MRLQSSSVIHTELIKDSGTHSLIRCSSLLLYITCHSIFLISQNSCHYFNLHCVASTLTLCGLNT